MICKNCGEAVYGRQIEAGTGMCKVCYVETAMRPVAGLIVGPPLDEGETYKHGDEVIVDLSYKERGLKPLIGKPPKKRFWEFWK